MFMGAAAFSVGAFSAALAGAAGVAAAACATTCAARRCAATCARAPAGRQAGRVGSLAARGSRRSQPGVQTRPGAGAVGRRAACCGRPALLLGSRLCQGSPAQGLDQASALSRWPAFSARALARAGDQQRPDQQPPLHAFAPSGRCPAARRNWSPARAPGGPRIRGQPPKTHRGPLRRGGLSPALLDAQTRGLGQLLLGLAPLEVHLGLHCAWVGLVHSLAPHSDPAGKAGGSACYRAGSAVEERNRRGPNPRKGLLRRKC